MGVEENEIVPIYGPFFPDVCSITCALNLIGATPYFLKLAMSKQDFEIETSESRFAIAFDGMWNNVKDVFSDDRFKKSYYYNCSRFHALPSKRNSNIF